VPPEVRVTRGQTNHEQRAKNGEADDGEDQSGHCQTPTLVNPGMAVDLCQADQGKNDSQNIKWKAVAIGQIPRTSSFAATGMVCGICPIAG